MALLINSLLVLPAQQLGLSRTHSAATSYLNYSHRCRATSSVSLRFCHGNRKVKTKASNADNQEVKLEEKNEEEEEEEEEFRVLTAMKSGFNDIVIVDTPKSRMLLLDSSHNVHSIVCKDQKWTASYWDEFASLPAIVPKGPIAILGLGGGTAAHLMLDLWPSLQLEGWEIDQILIDKAREYLGLSYLEKHTQAGGILNIHIGDALSPSVNIPGGYAGIVVDLFSDGNVLSQLQEVTTWLEIKNKLMPNGRLMVNCGGIDEASDVRKEAAHPKHISTDESWLQNSTIKALSKAFPGQVSWKKMPQTFGENYLALTGPLPEVTSWSAAVTGPLTDSVKQWRPCEPCSWR
ncbi:uncharacterized protein LOC103958090 isoform X2 [Pyrus x bretschneideri]|uniref:uncharacterized protein LOC103958090 isoform X2 n=1 Tax=Pyrus x bretschneideri TaxID=225117 RepID=UPI00202EFD8A|nr:uncharacterized protein LOC103958090 isoform X2 [Pyrus x bretschneideri]